ncbi:protein O-mannosyl-transferase family [Gaoshiqia sp. Z1-71]|uniref:protein O-mannosyl-transferase family n=1 Tax=Gaoshiqia hydrogeniformans TaxID=3290090 RepID=UPI003BF876F2
MKNYKFLNLVTGWVTFLIAAVTYLLTIEPTASFWDCGEFITTSYKLEVGHPPGAPFFMILGRFFTLFGNASQAGMLINALSALASAFTILFLFWSITHLAKKLVDVRAELSVGQTIAILGSGLIGALAYTFSDTFWFSAVEGEVYASSSLLTAIVFWAILKWENVADEPHANRWIILIAYIMGLSIGVHLLNLLAIPAIVFVYYFRKYKVTRNGVIACFLVSLLILGLIMYGIIPGVVTVASWFELLFTNSLGLPFNTGVIIYAVLLIGLVVYGIYFTIKKKLVLWNTVLVSLMVILIGYSSFAMIVIRSSANTPMDQNSPDNVFSLLGYLNREQYGDRPLVFGQYYNTPLDSKTPYVKSKPYYIQKDGKYVVADMRQKPNYDSRFTTVFPRMWSRQDDHIRDYKSWAGIKGKPVRITGDEGKPEVIEMPTFGENLTFFMRYQVVHMYFRYFMWNFAGRQNDIQGHGDILNGNWISGIDFIDSARLGDQKRLPDNLKNNKGRNTYYFLPLLLGLIGAFFHYKRNQKDFWVVMLLFFMTGLAIVIYLNQYPHQPRERDYAFAGSFYAFAVWIGLGVMALAEGLKRRIPETVSAIAVTSVSLVLVPGIMANENWDDHDRSDRYTARDFGANYLNSCDPNAIIFTNGDNDTFPLWYNQEVEGVRTDVRVCNLSYLQTDWYIDQMRSKAYESEPLPILFTHDQYVQGTRDVVYLLNDPRLKGAVELKKALDFVRDDSPQTKLSQAGNASYIPSKKLFIRVDKEAVIRNKVVPEAMYDQIVDTIFIDFGNRSYIVKDELMVLDMMANANWERPIYFAITVGRDKYLGLQDYFQLEGFAYRFTPVKTTSSGYFPGSVHTQKMYENLMTTFKWGNMNKPGVYIDENNQRMMMNIRNNFNRLAESLISEGKNDSAVQVLDKSLELIPHQIVSYNYFSHQLAENYFAAGAVEKGIAVMQEIYGSYQNDMDYYLSLPDKFLPSVDEEIQRILYFMREMAVVSAKYEQEELSKKITESFNNYLTVYSSQR